MTTLVLLKNFRCVLLLLIIFLTTPNFQIDLLLLISDRFILLIVCKIIDKLPWIVI